MKDPPNFKRIFFSSYFFFANDCRLAAVMLTSMFLTFLKLCSKDYIFWRILTYLERSKHFLPQRWVSFTPKVSKFQNEFMKSSFLPKCEPKIVRISALYSPHYRAEILTIFGSCFGRNDDFINSF